MTEYIDRDKLLEQLDDERPINWTDSEYEDGEQTCFEYMLEVIKEQPPADVVEVVRCKDCKYLFDNGLCYLNIKGVGYKKPKPNDFCSYGKREEDEHNA